MHTFDRKNPPVIWPFSEKLLQKVQSIGCLDWHSWTPKMHLWVRNYVCLTSCRFFIRASLYTLLAEKNCIIWPFLKKLIQKAQSIGCLDLHFWVPEMYSSARKLFVFFLSILYQCIIVHTFGRKKLLHLAFIRKVASKSTVYRLSRFPFLSPKMYFLARNLFSLFLVDSLSVHHCAPVLAEKTASFGLFSKSYLKMHSLQAVLICNYRAEKWNFWVGIFFVDFSCRIFIRAIIVHTLGR